MALDPKYFIHTGHDGSLEEPGLRSDPTQVDALVQSLATASRVALTIHGGLVPEKDAFATAETLLPEYLAAGVHPVFLVWKAGLLETLNNLLQDVWNEGLFNSLVQKLLRHVAAKVGGVLLTGARDADGLPALPDDVETARQYQKLNRPEVLPTAEREPFGDVAPAAPVSPPTAPEIERFEDDLARDPDFLGEAEAAARYVADLEQPPTETVARARLATEGPPKRTLANPELFRDETGPAPAPFRDRSGFFTAAKLVKAAVRVFVRIIARFVERRDHGVYATTVEEVLREIYGTNVGAAVWGTMKRQGKAAYENAGGAPKRGGWYFVQKLGELLSKLPPAQWPEISIVAHSAGAIYACHLLNHLAAKRGTVLPADFRIKNLLLMAPACDFGLFNEAATRQPPPFERFRMYALHDALESGYWEVPFIYPRSLLYLAAGAFETEADGETGAYDRPLVGMERYYEDAKTYGTPEVKAVRQFVTGAAPARLVWSVNAGGLGLDADSARHGYFFLGPDGAPTRAMRSALHVLRNGV